MGEEPKTIKIELTVSIGLHNCTKKKTIKVDAEDWADMDSEARDEFMEEELAKVVEWDYKELGDDE